MSEETTEDENISSNHPSNSLQKIKSFFVGIYRSIERISNQIGAISLEFFRSPGLIFWAIVLPIILVLLFGAIFGGSIKTSYELDILDLDQSEESTNFISYLENNTSLKITTVVGIVDDPLDWLKESNRLMLLVIPEGWGNNLTYANNGSLIIYYDHTSSSAITILQIVEETILERNLEILTIPEKIYIDIESLRTTDLRYIDTLIPGIITISSSIIVLITGLSYDLQEKQSGILKKFVSTPMFKFEWIFSKQIWLLIVVFLSSTISILFALIYDFNVSVLKPFMFIFVFFSTLTFSGIAMVLVRIINNPDGVMFASVIIILPQIFLSGALIPMESFPEFLIYIARIFPLYYLTEGMRALMFDITPQFWINFSISAALGLGLFLVGIIVSKWDVE